MLKAIVNKETAERMLADEELMINVNKVFKTNQLKTVDNSKASTRDNEKFFELEAKINTTYNNYDTLQKKMMKESAESTVMI